MPEGMDQAEIPLMSNLKDALARAWASDLQGRVPAGHRVYPGRRGRVEGRDVQPPFSVLTVMRMVQTTPMSNTWEADVRVVVVCDKDQGESAEQERRVREIYQALETTQRPAVDVDEGVRLYGFALETIEQAQADKVYSDVIFIRAGVGDMASSPGAVVLP